MPPAIRQAILLSAGLGTRLRPLTDNIPKVMVPLGGKPLLEWHIEALKKHGVREFFINLHYLPDVITGYFGDGKKFGVKIHYALEKPEILGTAGGVKNFSAEGETSSRKDEDGFLGDHFLVLYADTFYEIDYGRVIDFFFSKKEAIGMGTVRKTDHPLDSDLAIVAEDGRVTEFLRKPHGKRLLEALTTADDTFAGHCEGAERPRQSDAYGRHPEPEQGAVLRSAEAKDLAGTIGGIPRLARNDTKHQIASPLARNDSRSDFWGMSAPYIFSKEILKYIPPKKYYEIDHELVPDLLRRGYKYYAYRLGEGEFRKDIGTIERYREVEEYLKNKLL